MKLPGILGKMPPMLFWILVVILIIILILISAGTLGILSPSEPIIDTPIETIIQNDTIKN